MCAGQNLALMEIHNYIAQFFRHFEADILNEEQPWKNHSAFLTWKRDFMVKIRERFPHESEKVGFPGLVL